MNVRMEVGMNEGCWKSGCTDQGRDGCRDGGRMDFNLPAYFSVILNQQAISWQIEHHNKYSMCSCQKLTVRISETFSICRFAVFINRTLRFCVEV